MRQRTRATAGAAAAMLGLGVLAIAPGQTVSAAEISATSEAELRDAITAANANPDADTITLAAGTYTISSHAVDDDNTAGDFDITGGTLTIIGAGVGATVIDGGTMSRLFHVHPGATVTLEGVTIINGAAEGAPSAAGGASGGGILNAGTLTVTDSLITASTAARAGGGIEASAGSITVLDGTDLTDNATGASPGNGGGLHVTGNASTSITDATISGNSAAAEGGGVWNGSGTMMVTTSTIDANVASGDDADTGGGGAYQLPGGTLNLLTTTISNNEADGASGSGGGVLVDGGTLNAFGTTITANRASRAGGGIEITAAAGGSAALDVVTLSDNETGPAPGNGGGLHISGPANTTITRSTVSGNTAASEGGGLWNATGTMTVSDTSISENTASGASADQGGGGIYQLPGGTLDLTDVTVSGNAADGTAGSGGGILVDQATATVTGGALTDNTASRAGGGIEVNTGAGASLAIDGTSLTGNSTGPAPGNGGGVHITGAANSTITDATITGNDAAREGGGLWNGSGTMTVDNATITGNSAAGAAAHDGGGGVFNNGGTIEITGGSVSNNDATGAAGSGGGVFNLAGSITVDGTVIDGNTAQRAGGGYEAANTDATLDAPTTNTLIGVALAGNDAGASPGNGGGLHITGPGSVVVTDSEVTGNVGMQGAGLWNHAASTMDVTGTLVAANTVTDSTQGGGLYNQGGTMNVSNTTVTGNSSGFAVGALAGTTILDFVTVADNTDGGLHPNGSSIEASNSIIAGNGGDDCVGDTFTSQGFNVLGSTCDAGADDAADVDDPLLDALADNGGPTQSLLPIIGSPAIDLVADCGAVVEDQRGAARPVDGDYLDGSACDAGAIEAEAATFFGDVDTDDLFFTEIQWLGVNGYSNGTPVEGERPAFAPLAQNRRQAMAAFLYRIAGSPAVGTDPVFADVSNEHPFFAAIQWMGENGYSTGSANPDGGKPLFRPDATMRRQALAAFLYRIEAGDAAVSADPHFADVPASAQFFTEIQWMFEAGVSTGTETADGTIFAPTDPLLRRAIAAFMYRVYEAPVTVG